MTGPAEQAGADEEPVPEGESDRDELRRLFRPLREIPVEGVRVKVPKTSDPVPVRIGRYMEADERREVALICQDMEMEGQPWMLVVFPHALENKKALERLADVLAQPTFLGDRGAAWQVIRGCDHAMGIECEAWVDAKMLDRAETHKLLGERTTRLRELQASDERKDKGLLPEHKPETDKATRFSRKERRRNRGTR